MRKGRNGNPKTQVQTAKPGHPPCGLGLRERNAYLPDRLKMDGLRSEVRATGWTCTLGSAWRCRWTRVLLLDSGFAGALYYTRRMFCPKCEAEYRPGFTCCSDCGADLVDRLPRTKAQKEERLLNVWDGDSQADCVEVCRDLKRAGIAYRVAQWPVSRSIRMRVNWRFQVGVLQSDYETARAALGLDDAVNGGIKSQPFEIPQSIGPDSEFVGPQDERRSVAYLKPWHPENATVEIWWQVASDTPSIVELAFRENLIHYRLLHAENGKCKLFVLPEDEPYAQEILREIKKGEPPG